jgi:hypothetical protein
LDLKFSEEALQAMRQEKNNAVHTRNRIIEWPDPGAVREQADGLSLLDSIRAIRDGAGSLAVQAESVISVITSNHTLSSGPRAVSIKPGMWSTIWRTLEAMAG